jgi:hypothetical protein
MAATTVIAAAIMAAPAAVVAAGTIAVAGLAVMLSAGTALPMAIGLAVVMAVVVGTIVIAAGVIIRPGIVVAASRATGSAAAMVVAGLGACAVIVVDVMGPGLVNMGGGRRGLPPGTGCGVRRRGHRRQGQRGAAGQQQGVEGGAGRALRGLHISFSCR